MPHLRTMAHWALLTLLVLSVALLGQHFSNAQSVRALPQQAPSGPQPAAPARTATTNAAAPTSPQATNFTFSNPAPITINDNSNASPYPSNISVNNGSLTTVTRVQVVLKQFTHTFPDDVDIILVGPGGRRTMLMSDAGGGNPGVSNINLTFSQAAATVLPDTASPVLTTGAYRPANYETTDTFPAPGPGALTNEPADLSVFNLTNPNGIWNLYVVDDAGTDVGSIAGGWDLILTQPAVFTVNSAADPGTGTCDATECTLREAIAAAQNDDLINFSSTFNTPQTINLMSFLPDIATSVTIQGPGANLLTVRRSFAPATPNFSIFNIPSGVAAGVSISGMTITGGRAGGGNGGGIVSQSNLTLTNVHVTGNQANFGGGIFLSSADGVFTGSSFSGNTSGDRGGGILFQGNSGHTLRVTGSTVSGNNATNDGGGIENFCVIGNSRLEITGSTIVNNTSGSGGGIFTLAGNAGTSSTTTLRNTIIALNTSGNLNTSADPGAAAAFTTLGFNLSNDYTGGGFTLASTDKTSATPRLGPLSLGGGTTPTHALLGGSPAIDAGNAFGLTVDQRGQPRVFGASADIGAVEMRPLIVTSIANAGTGSLRNTIANANPNTDILFDPVVFSPPQTITLTTGELFINAISLNIHGPGANLLTVRRDNAVGDFRIFNIASGITGGVAISGMTITGGRATAAGDGSFGGGISSQSNLTLTNVHVTGNHASSGGAVALSFADGVFTGCTFSVNTATFDGGIHYPGAGGHTLRVINSTVNGNSATDSGGGISNISDNGNSRLEVVGSTIANNTGGGILTFTQTNPTSTATTTLRNTIIANNTPNNLATGTNGGGTRTVTTHGFNLANDDGGGFLNVAPITTDKINTPAGLAALADNGGTTPTRALLAGSAAIDAGHSSGFNTDQRGFTRPVDLSNIPNVNGGDGSDIGAFESSSSNGLMYYPLPAPVRLLDTRPGETAACNNPGAPLTGGSPFTLVARGACQGVTIPANAQAVVGNATVVNFISGPGFVTLYPSNATQPLVSNLNYNANHIVPNAFTVGLGTDGAFKAFASSTTHFIVDITGYYAPPGAGGLYYHPLPNPVRRLDTRAGETTACTNTGVPLTGGATLNQPARGSCQSQTIPAAAQAIVGNATVVNFLSGAGFITLWPSGASQPLVSNLNYNANHIVPNAFTVGLGTDGTFNIYASSTTHFIVDITGYYSAEAADANGTGLLYYPLATPVRRLDTRSGETTACTNPGVPLSGGTPFTQAAQGVCQGQTIPATAQAVVGNATVVNFLSGPGFITLWPAGAGQPLVSNLNYNANHIVPNAFVVKLGTGGAFNIFASSTTHFIADLTGYFAP